MVHATRVLLGGAGAGISAVRWSRSIRIRYHPWGETARGQEHYQVINDRHGGVMRAGGQQSQSSSRVGRTRLFADQQLNQEPGAARTWGAESDETPEEGQGAHGRGPVAGGGREAELQRPVDRIGAAGFVN